MKFTYTVDGQTYTGEVEEPTGKAGSLQEHIQRLVQQTTLAEAGHFLSQILGRSPSWKAITVGAALGAVGGGILAWLLWKKFHGGR